MPLPLDNFLPDYRGQVRGSATNQRPFRCELAWNGALYAWTVVMSSGYFSQVYRIPSYFLGTNLLSAKLAVLT